MAFEYIMLSEGSQTQEPCFILLHLYKMYRIGKSMEIESRLAVSRNKRGGKSGTSLVVGMGFLLE